MRQSLQTRLMLAFVLTLSLTLVFAAQAAPPAQEVDPAQGASLLPARVAFVHAAPFDTASSTVTLTVGQGSQTVIIKSGFTISSTLGYVSLPGGTHTFRLFAGALDAADLPTALPAYSEDITLQGGTDYTVIAAGTGPAGPSNPYPFDLIPFTDTLPTFSANQGLVRIIHAAPLPPGPSTSAVDVVNEADSTLLADNLAYGNGTPFVALQAGAYDTRVESSLAPGTPLFDPGPIPLAPGTIVTLVALIDGSTGDPGIVPLAFTPRADAQVRIVHAAPFATGSATVTPILDPTFGSAPNQIFGSLNYKGVSLYKTVSPGIYDAKVVAGTQITGTVALTQSLSIADGARLTVVVIGTGTTTYPLALETLIDDRTEPVGSATADVRFFHAAPFAASPAGSGVDLIGQDNTPLSPPLSDLFYSEVSNFATDPSPAQPYTTLPSGVPLALKLVATGTTTPVLDDISLTLGAGTVQTVIVVGGANQKPAELLVLNDLLATQRIFMPWLAR